MPIERELTEQELVELASNGVDPEQYRGKKVRLLTPEEQPKEEVQQQTVVKKPVGTLEAIADSLKQKTGAFVGGGIGGLGGPALASWALGPEVGLPVTLGAGIVGALGLSYGGQKVQEAIEGEEVKKRLEEEAAEAHAQHPIATEIADFAVGAGLAGGKFSPSTALKGGKGIIKALAGRTLSDVEKKAAANVGIQSTIMPAIQAGTSLATTGTIPPIGELAKTAGMASLFAEPNFLGKWVHRISTKAEPTKTAPEGETTPVQTEAEVPKVVEPSPFTDGSVDDNNVKALFMQTKAKKIPKVTKGMTDEEKYLVNLEAAKARAYNAPLRSIPIDDMRQQLHDDWIARHKELAEKKAGEAPVVKIPEPTTKPEPSTPVKFSPEIEAAIKTQKEVTERLKREELQRKVDEDNRRVAEEAARKQREEDFLKAREEVIKQNEQEILKTPKPGRTENQIRIQSLEGLLPSAVGRPEVRPEIRDEVPIDPSRGAAPKQETVEIGKPEPAIKAQRLKQVRTTFKQELIADPTSDRSHELYQEMTDLTRDLVKSSKSLGSVKEALASLHDDIDIGPLAKAMKIDEKSAKAKVIVSKELADALNDGASIYDGTLDTIILHPEDVGSPVVLHEIAHAALLKKLPKELWLPTNTGKAYKAALENILKTSKDEPLRDLVDAYLTTVKHLGMEDKLFGEGGYANKAREASDAGIFKGNQGYFLSDLHEFIAGIFDAGHWQRTLNEIPSGLNDGRSMWTRILDAIRQVFGLDVKHNSMLARVLKPTERLLARERGAVDYQEVVDRGALPESIDASRGAAPKTPGIPASMEKRGYSFIPFLTSRIDKIAAQFKTKTGQMVAENLHRFHGEFDYLKGEFGNRFVQMLEGYEPATVDKVYHYNHDIDNKGTSSIKLSPEEAKLSASIRDFMRKIGEKVQKEGPKIKMEGGVLRLMKLKKEGYIFNMIDRNVVHEWAENQNSPLAKKYDKAYTDHLESHGLSHEEAVHRLAEYKGALSNNVAMDVKFGALRKAEGYGLPWEIVDQNLASAATRYAERAARDLSYYKHIQSDPKMRKALGIADEEGHRMDETMLPDVEPIGLSDTVSKAMRSVYGLEIPSNPQFMAFARAAGNTVMGIGTAARNIITMPAIASSYAQRGQWKYIWKAIQNINDSKARAFSSNAVKTSFMDFDAAGYVKDNPNPVINLLDKYSRFMRKYQGRDFSDKFEGEYFYSLGELLATDNIAKAKLGNKESLRFLDRFSDIVEGGTGKLLTGKVTQDDISRIAKRFVDATRGTYSAEGLPSFALEGELAPFAALSRFAIEKSNTVWKDVIEPARNGNFAPLFAYTLSSLGIGVGIEQLNELLTNKRGPDATVAETLDDPNVENVTAKAISLLQLASFAGIIADGAKAATQMYQGKELRYNQPLSLPLYTLVTDTLMGNFKDAAAALQEGQDPFEVMALLATTVVGQSVQTMRYVDANLLRPEEAKRKEKFRDMTVFRQMEGKQSGPVIKSNPFLDMEGKEFKRTKDVGEAMKMLPGLIQKAIEDSKGDPYELQRRLRGLKQNNYQTMPSFETAPISYLRYINRLKNTQGEEAAAERLQDFILQNAANRAKSAAVP